MSVSWGDVPLLALVAVVGLLLFQRPSDKKLREYGETFAQNNLAYVDSEFVRRFDEMRVRGSRWFAVIWMGGLGTAVLVQVFAPRGPDTETIIFAGVAIVGAVAAVAQLRLAGREFPAPPGRPVVARVRHVGVTDYVPPIWLYLCFAACIVGVLLGVDAVRVALSSEVDYVRSNAIGTALLAGLLAPLAALAPLYMRLICERPQSAVDHAHLYFQDAWRAQQLRNVVGFVLAGTAMVVALGSLEVLPEFTINLILPWGFLAAFVAGGLLYRHSQLWFRKRLWPELAPGQVIRPGEVVAA